ncbi:hypothetical protein COEX109129_35720 [Corallococcus exiguus]
MATTRLAKGKKPSQKTGRVTRKIAAIPPQPQVIDFLLDSPSRLRVKHPITINVRQTLLFVVWTPSKLSAIRAPRITWTRGPSVDRAVIQCRRVAKTPQLNAYVGAFTPEVPGCHEYQVKLFDDTAEGPRVATGTIEVSGGGEPDGTRAKGPRRAAVRRRAARSTRG